MISMILLRALHKDISRYNALEAQVSCSVLMVVITLTLAFLFIGGRSGRLWLEISTWGCLQTS